jgi:hypothetical protein
MTLPNVATTDINPASINITWSAVTSAAATGNCSISGYLLEWSTTGTGGWSSLTSSTYTTTYFTQTSGFASNTNYYYRITP